MKILKLITLPKNLVEKRLEYSKVDKISVILINSILENLSNNFKFWFLKFLIINTLNSE